MNDTMRHRIQNGLGLGHRQRTIHNRLQIPLALKTNFLSAKPNLSVKFINKLYLYPLQTQHSIVLLLQLHSNWYND